jgi:hypothetical protein
VQFVAAVLVREREGVTKVAVKPLGTVVAERLTVPEKLPTLYNVTEELALPPTLKLAGLDTLRMKSREPQHWKNDPIPAGLALMVRKGGGLLLSKLADCTVSESSLVEPSVTEIQTPPGTLVPVQPVWKPMLTPPTGEVPVML